MMLDKDFLTKKIPLWHIIILISVWMMWSKLSNVATAVSSVENGVNSANRVLGEHGEHLDRIDSALYYKFNIRTAPQMERSPRQNSLVESTNNLDLVKAP